MTSMPDSERLWVPSRKGVHRIAVVIPQRGTSGIFGPSCAAAARLAAAELNEASGVRGDEVELVMIDGGESPSAVSRALRCEMASKGLDAVTGWHISSVRRAIEPTVRGIVPYVYPALYEGGEHRPGVFCTGEVPEAQVAPALRWLRDEMAVSRWFIVGNDYIWPRLTTAATVSFARQEGLEITGTSFVSLSASESQISAMLDLIERSRCHGVLMLFPGQDGVEFNRQFSARELHRDIIRFSPLMEENMLMATGPDATHGIFSAAGYFRSAVSGGALDFQGRYSGAYGPDAPALNAVAESTYSAVRVVAALAERADGRNVLHLPALLDGTVMDLPRGRLRFEGSTVTQDVYLAVADGCDFMVVDRL